LPVLVVITGMRKPHYTIDKAVEEYVSLSESLLQIEIASLKVKLALIQLKELLAKTIKAQERG